MKICQPNSHIMLISRSKITKVRACHELQGRSSKPLSAAPSIGAQRAMVVDGVRAKNIWSAPDPT